MANKILRTYQFNLIIIDVKHLCSKLSIQSDDNEKDDIADKKHLDEKRAAPIQTTGTVDQLYTYNLYEVLIFAI